MYDIEFTEEELMILDNADEFISYLMQVHSEYCICEIDEMYNFYFNIGWFDHCNKLIEFKKEYIDG